MHFESSEELNIPEMFVKRNQPSLVIRYESAYVNVQSGVHVRCTNCPLCVAASKTSSLLVDTTTYFIKLE